MELPPASRSLTATAIRHLEWTDAAADHAVMGQWRLCRSNCWAMLANYVNTGTGGGSAVLGLFEACSGKGGSLLMSPPLWELDWELREARIIRMSPGTAAAPPAEDAVVLGHVVENYWRRCCAFMATGVPVCPGTVFGLEAGE